MSDWSHGYDVSMGYSFGFFREMAPDWLDFCTRLAGYEAPERAGGKFRYLELGSGQGFGLCLLAAANPDGEFVGVDFQPEHIAHSRNLAEAAGLTNVRFVEADFMELAADWPEPFGSFDYVTLHGIFSWVSPELRGAVLQCLDHGTASGGLVYVSYNAHPGWLGTVPFQHFARLIKDKSEKPATAAVDESLDLLGRLAAARAPVFQALPTLGPKIEAMKGREKSYLVHEFLAQGWNPFWHSEVRLQFAQASLDYVASATLADDLVSEFLPSPLYDAVAGQQDRELREDLQDFIINKAFRRDIFCRGPRRRTEEDSGSGTLLHQIAAPEPGAPVNFETSFGQVTWEPQVFRSILEATAQGPKTVDDLFRLPNPTAWQPRHVLLLMLHASMLDIRVAHPGSVEAAQRMNAVVARAVANGAPYKQLAAANVGSGITVDQSEMLLLDAWLESGGTADQDGLAAGLAPRLEKLGQSDAEPLDRLAARFVNELLPRWRQLGVVA